MPSGQRPCRRSSRWSSALAELDQGGVNQVIMLSALDGGDRRAGRVRGARGVPVVSGLQSSILGLAFEGGIGIVVLAIILDRVTRGIGGGGKARKAS